ncbi:MAG: sigma-70 family RNA polymerase sigma factor [Prevotellaceae bacterium]|nr:sigma-70 family RNA polymerase sigma factor [Prevotella sp.]MDD7258134.1 sigma-70 family RNA polymerase sigma factor [Prevotellaceae bacterium]MDY6131120.1 sigma-70 family RNA polymerase sigma factor [Prevotella sp.]
MEESAFEQIAPQLREKALGTSLKYGADNMQAEDIAQDVMVRLWQIRHDLGRYRSLEAVAAQAAKHLLFNLRRREGTLPLQEDTATATATAYSPEDQFEESENEAWLQQRLKSLPDTQYLILHMRQVENKSGKEIAATLGIAETSVRTLLAKARKALLEDIRKRDTR